jgi:hypothetical protein
MYRSTSCVLPLRQRLWVEQGAGQLMLDAGVSQAMMITMVYGRVFMLRGWRSNTLSRVRRRTGSAPGTGACDVELRLGLQSNTP